MNIIDEPPFRQGRVFYAITEDDPPYLVYMGKNWSLLNLRNLAEEYGEDLYTCIQYKGGTVQHCTYAAGNRS